MHQILQQLVNGIALGGMYALIALGYTMVYGIIELINFAHGDVYALGSFYSIAVLGMVGVGAATILGGPLAFIVALGVLAAAALLCGLTGVVIERVAYRRLRNAPRLAPLISAIGVSLILENLMQQWHGPSHVPFPQFLANAQHSVAGVTFSTNNAIVVIITVVSLALLNLVVYRTRLGAAMRATAQDRDAAALMGINVNNTIAWTFFIGSALAGVAGFVSGLYYGSTFFLNGYRAGLVAFTAAVLGGIGNITGAMLGGFVIGVVEALSTQFLGDQWSGVVVFSILILILVFRPSGLLGEQLPEKA